MRILIVEDEPDLLAGLAQALREEGYAVDTADNGEDGLFNAEGTDYDAIVLDVMLPGRDGLSVLRQLRELRNTVPVLLLTARSSVTERIEGLNAGADDYLGKPFSLEELVARLRAIVRRQSGTGLSVLQYEDLSVNLITREVVRARQKIDLSTREFALLEYLLRLPGRVLTRAQLCEQVWDYHFDTGTNVVDVCVQRLRRKLDDGFDVKLVQTVRGVGYTLKAGP